MNIIFSSHLSYCPGVKRTLRLIEKLLQGHPGKIYYMLGELIHNEHVIGDLKARGLRMIHGVKEIREPGSIIIQSHGAPRKLYETLQVRSIPYIDATCPMVKVIHEKIRKLESDGYFPIVIGKDGHEEVKGIVGQVNRAEVIGTEEEVTAARLSGISRAGIVVQSTFIRSEAERIVSRIGQFIPEVAFVDTICEPTVSRQEEIKRVANEYDCILIIGSKSSANTNHLFQMASQGKSCAYLIDDPETVFGLPIRAETTVFIASGASTPDYLIDAVVSNLKRMESLTQERMKTREFQSGGKP